MNYLLGQCREYYLDVQPPENVKGFLTQLEKISENNDAAPVLLNDAITLQIGEYYKFIAEQ